MGRGEHFLLRVAREHALHGDALRRWRGLHSEQAANLKKCVGDAEETLLPGAEASSHSSAVDSKPVNGKPPAGWGPRKMTDGNISGGSDGKSLRSNKTGPQSLMQTLSQVFAEPVKPLISPEEKMQKVMGDYTEMMGLTPGALTHGMEIETRELVTNSFGLDIVLSIYCTP
jgi:hypothetical protein